MSRIDGGNETFRIVSEKTNEWACMLRNKLAGVDEEDGDEKRTSSMQSCSDSKSGKNC